MMPKEPDLAKYGMDGADPEANDKFQDGVTGAFVDKMPSGRKIIKNGGQIWYFVSADTLEKSKVSPKELALHYLKRMNGLGNLLQSLPPHQVVTPLTYIPHLRPTCLVEESASPKWL